MEKGRLREVLLDQQETFARKDYLIGREISLEPYLKGNEIVVVSGIRRCGKSSLLRLIAGMLGKKSFYVDFSDIRFTDFGETNYGDIEDLVWEFFGQNQEVVFLLDEVQEVPAWERWVSNLYEKGTKVFVTGSNSKMLSSEISTYLTGRNKVVRLFPFSFREYLSLKRIKSDPGSSAERRLLVQSFSEYFEKGGFPLVLKNDDLELSKQYFKDILNKDIITRYNIRKKRELNDLVLFLFSNVGRTYSYSTLSQVSGISSFSMIKNYIDYLENSYIAHSMARFDFSVRKQKISSSKFYVTDNSFLRTVAFNFSQNYGARLENLVFIELARCGYETYYHKRKHECNFIIRRGLRIDAVIQVCQNMDDPMVRKRELDGLMEAMNDYKLTKGLILTLETEDTILLGKFEISVKPVWKWLLSSDKLP